MQTHSADIPAYLTKVGSEIRELMHPAQHGNRNQGLAEATYSTDRTLKGLLYSENCRMIYFSFSAFADVQPRQFLWPFWSEKRSVRLSIQAGAIHRRLDDEGVRLLQDPQARRAHLVSLLARMVKPACRRPFRPVAWTWAYN